MNILRSSRRIGVPPLVRLFSVSKFQLVESKSNLPPSFKNSKPLAQNTLTEDEKRRLSIAIAQAEKNESENQPKQFVIERPWYTNPFFKLLVVFIPCIVVGVGYITYETLNGRPVFFPLYVNSAVPLEKAYGFENVDVELIKDVARETLSRRLNMNQTIRENLGLPLHLGEYEQFDIMVEYNTLAFEGIELDFRKSWWPEVRYREIQAPQLPKNVNKYIKPLRATAGGDLEEADEIEMNSIFKEELQYVLKIRARIQVIDEVLHRIEPGSARITFNAEVNFDHTRLIRITSALMHYKNKDHSGSGGTLEKLW